MGKLPSILLVHQRLSGFSLNIVIVFSVSILTTLIGMVTGILVARALGPSGKGQFTLITTFPALVFCLVHLGIAEANVYFLRKENHRVEPGTIRSNTLYLTALISGITILVVVMFRGYVSATFLPGLPSGYFSIILLLFPLLIFETFGSSMLVAFERFKMLSFIGVLTRIFDTVTIVVVLYVFHLGLLGVVLSYVFVFALKCLGYYLTEFWRKPMRRLPDLKSMYESIVFGIKSHAQSLTGVLHYKIDIYILAIFLSTTEIGYYSVAVSLVSLIFFIPDAVGYVMYPRMTSLSDEEAHRFTAQTCRNTLFITMLPALGIFIFGRWIIQLLYGSEFLPSISALYLLLPGTISMCIYKILTRNFTSRNRQQLTVFAGLLGLGINVTMNLILIPRIGIAGAAIATSVSYSTTSFLLLFFFLRDSGVRFVDSLFIKGSDLIELFQVVQKAFVPQTRGST